MNTEIKSPKEFWKEKFDEEPQSDSDKLAVVMMQEYVEYASIKSKGDRYWEGFKYACDLANEMYASGSSHEYMIGDCILSKVNKLSKEKVRKNTSKSKGAVSSVDILFDEAAERNEE